MRVVFLRLVIVLGILAWSPDVSGQAPPVQWQHCYGGTSIDAPASVDEGVDGGFILAGFSNSGDGDVIGTSYGNTDIWLVKTNDYGAISWEQCYGGSGSESASVIMRKGRGYVVAGYSGSSDFEVTGLHGLPYPHSSPDYWIFAIDSIGDLQWEKTFGGSNPDLLYGMVPANGGGFVLAGGTLSNDGDITNSHGISDAWIVKIDDTGGLVWQKAIGDTGINWANSICKTTDNGYVIAGYSNADSISTPTANRDLWVVKLDDTGGVVWQKYFGGSDVDEAESIAQTADGGYIVAGTSRSANGDVMHNYGDYDIWVIKLSAAGTLQWSKTYGGSGDDEPAKIIQTLDGGYALACYTNSTDSDITGNHGSYDAWVVKLDDTGAIEWRRTLGGTDKDYASDIRQTADSGYIVLVDAHSYNGDVSGAHGNSDYWVVRMDKHGAGIPSTEKEKVIKVYPVPARDMLYFEFPSPANSTIKLMDITGRLMTQQLTSNNAAAKINVSDYPAGLYIYRATSGNRTWTGKVVVSR